MRQATINAAGAYAVDQYPREACGLVVVAKGKERFIPCRNVAQTPAEHFVIPGEDYAAAEEQGTVTALVHSHPDETAMPSQADRVSCEASGLRWLIIAVRKEDGIIAACETAEIEPEGYVADLVGREFTHGVLDCYTLVRDWYAREMGVELPDYERRDNWWNEEGVSLYEEHFIAANFERVVGDWRRGDIILMQIRARVPNHAAVYLGDGMMIHHLYGRLSTRDIYGGQWQEQTRYAIRMKGLDDVE